MWSPVLRTRHGLLSPWKLGRIERIARWRAALERIRTARTVREARAIAEEALTGKPPKG